MSISGPGLYQDDTGFDVRSIFRELVSDGKTASEARAQLVAEWAGLLDDRDQACAFWLALADTESRTGRLEDEVRDRALALIESGEDLARFEYAAPLHRKRRLVLDDLRARLLGPQRAPLRIRKPFRSVSPVGVGDVFTFTLPSGRVVWLRCLAVHGDALDSSPTVEALDWNRAEPPADPTEIPHIPARPYQQDKFWMVRYPRDPDPSERIQVFMRGTRVSRGSLPSVLTPWANLEERLAHDLGLGGPAT